MSKRPKTNKFFDTCRQKDDSSIQLYFKHFTTRKLFDMLFDIGPNAKFPFLFLIEDSKYNELLLPILLHTRVKYARILPIDRPIPSKGKSKLMQYGYYLLNETRKIICLSWNHPSNYNKLGEIIKKREENLKKGKEARDKVLFQNLKKALIKDVKQINENLFKVNLHHALQRKMLKANIQPAIRNGIGNCFECAVVAFLQCKKYKSEIMHLKKGDHAVLIIENLIVVDPWLGVVYLKSELQTKLMTYIQVNYNNQLFNIVTNAKYGLYDELVFYSLSPSGYFDITVHDLQHPIYKLLKSYQIQ